jgi:CubicO group peptidase (beta-lactamase class C family)
MRKLSGTLTQQRQVYVTHALQETPEHTPGTSYAYSNSGYVIAGAMAERATQRAWEDLVRDLVFKPLDMQAAGFGPTAHEHQLDAPWPHQMAGGKPEPIPDPTADNPLLMAPAGSIHAPIESWARFVREELAGLEGHGQLLTAAAYQTLFTPGFGGDYANGWIRVQRTHAFTHAGSNTMNFALAWLMPKRRLAVLVATNVGSGATFEACDSVVSRLMAGR